MTSERKKGLYGLLSNATLYESVQRIFQADTQRRDFQQTFVRAKSGDRVLDIGCGPAHLLACLPDVEYVGFEPNADYVAKARDTYGDRATFHVGLFGPTEARNLTPVDIAIVSGVLHHMSDEQTNELFSLLRQALKPGGRVITVDPVLIKGQNPIARLLIKLDRGRNVRSPAQYEALARNAFGHVDGRVLAQRFPPYNRFYMTVQ